MLKSFLRVDQDELAQKRTTCVVSAGARLDAEEHQESSYVTQKRLLASLERLCSALARGFARPFCLHNAAGAS